MDFQVVPGGGWQGEEFAAVPMGPGGYDIGFGDGGEFGAPCGKPQYGMQAKAMQMPMYVHGYAAMTAVPAQVNDGAHVGDYMPVHLVPAMENAVVPSVVPSFVPTVVPNVVQNIVPVPQPVPAPPTHEAKDLETVEMRQKPRWETPRRRGNWTERWQSARDMGAKSVPAESAITVAASVRRFVSKIVNVNVGLPLGTVEKWFHLLAEYLELSVDEHLIMVCLFRKYVDANGPLVSNMDWARPQKWECVLAIACYLAVLLSEEFAGQTARELKDLLGPQFRFGAEQSQFLKTTDWRINISAEEFIAARDVFAESTRTTASEAKLNNWFLKNKNAQKSYTKAPVVTEHVPVGKKRSRVDEEALVPEAKKREIVHEEDFCVPSWN